MWAFLGMIKSPQERWNVEGARTAQGMLLGNFGALLADANMRRGPLLQAAQDTQGRRQEGHVAHRGHREPPARSASRQLQVERKYGRLLPTAMERELLAFLEEPLWGRARS